MVRIDLRTLQISSIVQLQPPQNPLMKLLKQYKSEFYFDFGFGFEFEVESEVGSKGNRD